MNSYSFRSLWNHVKILSECMIFYVYTKPCFMVQCSKDILKTLNLLGSIVTRGSDCETCCILVIPLLQEKSAITIKDCESSKCVSYHLLLIADGNRNWFIHWYCKARKKKNLCSSATSTISSQQLTFSSHLPHGQDPGQGIFITILKQVSFFGKWKVFRWILIYSIVLLVVWNVFTVQKWLHTSRAAIKFWITCSFVVYSCSKLVTLLFNSINIRQFHL